MKFPIKLSGTGIVRRTRGKPQSGLTKASAREMAKIAKRVVNTVAETKTPLTLVTAGIMVDNIVHCVNPLFNIAQGDTLSSRDGQKIHLSSFYIKGKFTAINNATVGNGVTSIRFMIVKTPQIITNSGLGTTFGATSAVWRGTQNNLSVLGVPDLSKVQVVYDKLINMRADIQNTNEHYPFVIKQKINKKFQFALDAASYGKEDNYYFVFVANKTDGTVGNCAAFDFQYAVNFKDI